jgi:glycosyltransferase involved in cell wall biosynthesis
MTTPAFSILLPTRNRLDLARGAIETVRLQDDPDWELVLADNCSDDDVAGYVASLADPRIRHIRSDGPLSVTDNWNRAIDAARGDFIVMLGDDDGLTPGYISAMRAEMAASAGAEFAFHGGWHFTFPGVLPGMPEGGLVDATANHAILFGRSESQALPREEARRMAAAALRLNVLYGFNMQYFLFTRSFLDRLREHGPVFQGPFPDFYAANLAMLAAARIWLVPRPMVIVGISPKSYGFHHFNRDEGTGADFLGIGPYLASREGFAKDLLPGSVMNSAWYLSVALIPRELGGEPSPPLAKARYRRLQIVATVAAAARGEAGPGAVAALAAELSPTERLYLAAVRLAAAPAGLLPKAMAGRWLRLVEAALAQQHPRNPPTLPPPVLGRYRTMPDVFHGLRSKAPQ